MHINIHAFMHCIQFVQMVPLSAHTHIILLSLNLSFYFCKSTPSDPVSYYFCTLFSCKSRWLSIFPRLLISTFQARIYLWPISCLCVTYSLASVICVTYIIPLNVYPFKVFILFSCSFLLPLVFLPFLSFVCFYMAESSYNSEYDKLSKWNRARHSHISVACVVALTLFM